VDVVRFKQVDVFPVRPFLGNPVAVILEADRLSDAEMAAIARWTNLSETTFVLPSDRADYRLRIFTPGSELPFAGHPTVGSAHALIEAGLVTPSGGALTQECIAGVIPLRVEADGRIAARVPAPKVLRDASVAAEQATRWLNAEVTTAAVPVNVGPTWLVAQVSSVEALNAARPDLAAIAAMSTERGLSGITAFAIDPTAGAEARLHVRSFAPADGIAEDPVCGSGNAAVGAYLGATGLLSQTGRSYVAAQGMAMGRDGRVDVSVLGPDHVEIGGHAVTVLEGTIRLR
jgi:PhzF family phenazine biosynthesis protein